MRLENTNRRPWLSRAPSRRAQEASYTSGSASPSAPNSRLKNRRISLRDGSATTSMPRRPFAALLPVVSVVAAIASLSGPSRVSPAPTSQAPPSATMRRGVGDSCGDVGYDSSSEPPSLCALALVHERICASVELRRLGDGGTAVSLPDPLLTRGDGVDMRPGGGRRRQAVPRWSEEWERVPPPTSTTTPHPRFLRTATHGRAGRGRRVARGGG